jgi:hypothetical protein
MPPPWEANRKTICQRLDGKACHCRCGGFGNVAARLASLRCWRRNFRPDAREACDIHPLISPAVKAALGQLLRAACAARWRVSRARLRPAIPGRQRPSLWLREGLAFCLASYGGPDSDALVNPFSLRPWFPFERAETSREHLTNMGHVFLLATQRPTACETFHRRSACATRRRARSSASTLLCAKTENYRPSRSCPGAKRSSRPPHGTMPIQPYKWKAEGAKILSKIKHARAASTSWGRMS